MMDWQDIAEFARSLWTVWLTLLFVGIAFYAFRPRNKKRFDDCAQIPFRAEVEERPHHE
jgi:cytochrome c oxidase cbb3-type subunit 4